MAERLTAEDMARIRQKLSPVLVFMRVSPMVKYVDGAEIKNRQKVLFIPRNG